MSYPSEKDFLECVENHRTIILKDDGVYRNIRFKKPGTGNQFFDLITWPGFLCYTGDMGTFVFQRHEDMFQFFRHSKGWDGKLNINPGYWGEKLEAIDPNRGFKKFCPKIFKESVVDYIKGYELDKQSEKITLNELEDLVFGLLDGDFDEPQRAFRAIQEADFSHVNFSDFVCDNTCEDYTYGFTWALYAIAWGVIQYDKAKA